MAGDRARGADPRQPDVGVDIGAKDGIYEIVAASRPTGSPSLLISDEIPEVYYHSHRVLVMREGRIAGEFAALRRRRRRSSRAAVNA